MHTQFLLAALDQAWLGRGKCAPNPSVGAVAVQNDQIIAQSWHHGAGTPHAESLLLAKLPKNLSNITLYVTLEPCNHWGKTPPCVDAIIQYGIKRVVYAYHDPNPLVVANSTPAILQDKGIEVLHYPLTQIDEFYKSYKYWTATKKPWVTVKIAQTLDGKIAGAHGERVAISNENCSKFTHKKRLHSDVILTTARTINQDNPLLNARWAENQESKPVAVLDSHCSLNYTSVCFNVAKECHIYHDQHYLPQEKHLNCSYHPIPSKNDVLDLELVITHLGQLGYHDVWVEAGSRLFNALHQMGLVNKTYIYIAPTLLDENAMSAYLSADLFKNASNISWKIMGDNVIASFNWLKESETK